MDVFNANTSILEFLAVPSLMVLVLLVVLTMRSIVLRDRAMTFGKTREPEAHRAAYERRWRDRVGG